MSPSQLIPIAVQRSPVAHLFHFYPLLCEIAALPNKPPSAWVAPSIGNVGETVTVLEQAAGSAELHSEAPEPKHSSIGVTLSGKAEAVEVNSRQLSRDCLIVIGRELGSQV